METEHVYNKEWMYETTKKRRDYFLEKLEVEGAKMVVVINSLNVDAVNDFKNPEGNYVVLGVANNGVSSITWYKDIKIHREDGPAYESYYAKTCGDKQYYYEGNWCYNVGLDSPESIISSYETLGCVILSSEKITDKVLRLKVLSKDYISDKWYYIPNGA